MSRSRRCAIFVAVSLFAAGCASSGPSMQREGYARLKDSRLFEYEFPVVWKGIEEAFRKYQIAGRDPSDVDPIELKKLRKRTLETEWLYGQSRDKYIETQVDGVPHRIPLQTRVKYTVVAQSRLEGTQVQVKTAEEIQKLNSDGSPAGYETVPDDQKDSSRPSEALDKINLAILSAAP